MQSSKPKIAHVVCTYPPYRGGMGQVAFEYTERLRDRGYDVHVFTTKHKPHVVNDLDYVHRLPSIVHVGNAGVMPSLYRRLSGFDLVHLHYPFYGGAEPIVVRKALRNDQGLILTYHMDATADGLRGVFFAAHKRILLPWILNRSDRILISSEDYLRASAIAEFEGIRDRIEIHPFGIDLKRFYPYEKKSDSVQTILFVGGLDDAHYFKGLPVLLHALTTILDLDWQLIIVGEGNRRTIFESLVAEYGIQDRVFFRGSVSEDELSEIYRASDIHVFPSTRSAEAFGLVALEAAASGIPTIASNLPGVRTVVQDGNTGLLVPPENEQELASALRFLLTNIEIRLRFGRAARAHAEAKFAWEPLIAKLEETYRSVWK